MHPYACAHYAKAFGDRYTPLFLVSAESHILKRPIPETSHFDAMGCYPICVMKPDTDFDQCFAELRRQQLVSFVLVTDIFYAPPPDKLAYAFEHCKPFKPHYLHDFAMQGDYSAHHRYEVKQAHTQCEVRVIALKDYLPQWIMLYQQLVSRHHITGIQAFSEHYFTQLAAMEGLVTIAAFHGNNLLAAHSWVAYEDVVYSHLAASSEEGYSCGASYAIYDYAIAYFRKKNTRAMDLGGGAGTGEGSDGLGFFKKGFSNRTERNFLCGKVLDEKLYKQLSHGDTGAFFPAYRKG